jgi:diadenylate cyclase
VTLDGRYLEVLRQVAPGTALRPGLERILRANTGALIVLGSPPAVEALFTGGFQIDIPFTAQRLSELAKMDGALVLDETASRILWANVHLMPDPAIPTVETGTRHRTAERVARQAGVPVVSVSHSMRTITLYVEDWRHVLEEVGSVLSRANQAVATLVHYRARFDEARAALDAAELHGQATLRDVLTLLGRAELVRRVAGELEQYVAELGSEGRLLRLQLEEQNAGVDDEERLAVRDHLRERPGWDVAGVLAELGRLTPEELSDTAAAAKAIDLTGDPQALDAPVGPRGYRLLARVPQLPPSAVERVVERFGSLKVILAVGPEDLEEVEGVGPGRARLLPEGLRRLADGAPRDGDE